MKPLYALRLALVGMQFGLIPPMIVCGLAQHWTPMFGCFFASIIVAKINLSLGVGRA